MFFAVRGTNCYSCDNHVIDLKNVKVINRESDKTGRLIREAIWIRKSKNMNRDDGSYQLSHIPDKLLTGISNRKSVLMKTLDRRSKLENKSFFGYIKLIGSYGQIVRLLDLV